MPSQWIVVVEDNDQLRESWIQALRSEDYKVVGVRDGAELGRRYDTSGLESLGQATAAKGKRSAFLAAPPPVSEVGGELPHE
jgi:CheY-like chemotaxis protein